jgi:hypothetical protein
MAGYHSKPETSVIKPPNDFPLFHQMQEKTAARGKEAGFMVKRKMGLFCLSLSLSLSLSRARHAHNGCSGPT